ncbi:MAG: hypothetical protein QM705_01785 [Ancrocorticia sp.]
MGYSVTDVINLRLALLGHAVPMDADMELVGPLIAQQQEFNRRLEYRPCAADHRIQVFLDDYLQGTGTNPVIPSQTLVLDQLGLARALSLPSDADEFSNDLLSSYRLANGVLHNPANDRRTTAGVFHIAEGGLPIPDDKRAVPKAAFGKLMELAMEPPQDLLTVPYTSNQENPARTFVSLLLRPLVVPEVHGRQREKRMEIRFIVPGGLVANLDFVEGIFGNGGDPFLADNDSALDPTGWTGTSGLVILAPHLTKVTKKELGLPRWEDATERQRHDHMCYKDEAELYNDGQAFKCCARDERGVIVTVIADNYFGYCKKEVKTQISYSANLFGNAEEEHAGGARVFPAYTLGQTFTSDYVKGDSTVADVVARNPERFELQPEGHALDTRYPEFVLVPPHASYSLLDSTVSWTDADGTRHSIPLRAKKTYFAPDGYRVFMRQLDDEPTQWTLVGVSPVSTTCHKPSTVSGGGKSEISKALSDAFIFGNLYSPNFDEDMDTVQSLLERDYSDRFADGNTSDHRSILSHDRSIGSVIKLLTQSEDYTAEYNEFLETIPAYIKEIVYTVKRYIKPEWGENWREHFSVGIMNDRYGNFIRLDGEKIVNTNLRVGFTADGSWRLFSLRPDFHPATKVQTEDDITASVVMRDRDGGLSRKYVENCEQLLFQRPDDAKIRGYDKQTERDLSEPGSFISNFEPLTRTDAREMRDDAVKFSQFSDPMQEFISRVADEADDVSPKYFVSSADARIVDGARSKNPRYLQVRPDLSHPVETAASDLAAHLVAGASLSMPLPLPVDVVAAGRRNNPPEEKVPALCSYNPLHFMELPELFMEFISSMTGKSPSTTGAGSEGAMTKGPFNALPATFDLNAGFLSYALAGYDGWISSAGYIGPHTRIDHDFSLLVPELFSRMTPEERDAHELIEGGYLEKIEDFELNGKKVLASRLGYRMTQKFATAFFGRIFMHPQSVFSDSMLRPELQDLKVFADSVDTIVATHQRVAQAYIADGTISYAVPPIRALLEIMANGESAEGWTLDSPEFRALFERENILASDWYADRIAAKHDEELSRIKQGLEDMNRFLSTPTNAITAERLHLTDRIAAAEAEYAHKSAPEYPVRLIGQIGLQPLK